MKGKPVDWSKKTLEERILKAEAIYVLSPDLKKVKDTI